MIARGRFPDLDQRSSHPIKNRLAVLSNSSEAKRSGGAHLNTSRAANAFWIFHSESLIGKVHDIDSLVTNRGANVAGNTLRFFRENPEAREACVDVHESGQRTKEPAPDASRIFEIKTDTDDAAEENIDHPLVVDVGDQLSRAVFSLQQQVKG